MHSISSDCLFAEKEEIEGGEGGKMLGQVPIDMLGILLK